MKECLGINSTKPYNFAVNISNLSKKIEDADHFFV